MKNWRQPSNAWKMDERLLRVPRLRMLIRVGEAGSASECLSRAIRELAPVSNLDETAGNLYSQLMEIDSLLNDFNHDLSDYQDSLEFSEEDYMTITERLNEINRLKTKYGTDIAGILDYGIKQQKKIQKKEDYENYIADLKRDLAQKRAAA